MNKVKLHITNEEIAVDDDVFVIIELPSIPRIGDILFLSREIRGELERKATSSVEIAQKYSPKWFYGIDINDDEYYKIQEKDLDHLHFDDAYTISYVSFTANSEIVSIEIDR